MRYPDWHRVKSHKFRLSKVDTRAREDRRGKQIERADAEAITAENIRRLQELQFLLHAEHKHSILVVFQALDSGGKDGAIRKCFGALNPQGVRVQGYKRPTDVELEHDYLWRVHQHTPQDGHIQVFNRSHYEDVLVVRVHDLVPEERWRRRYEHIRNFERLLFDEGTTVLKFMLHISKDEQKERLQARLDDPTRHWKFELGDLAERKRWDDYQEAYQEALRETSTDYAPWYVVPADRKWYRNYVITSILLEHMESLEMEFPEPQPGLEDVVVE